MYINTLWIIVLVALASFLFIKYYRSDRELREAYKEQREITNMFLEIAANNVPPKTFARLLVHRLVNQADISDENLFAMLTAWGVSDEVAIILSSNVEGIDAKEGALVVATKQVFNQLQQSKLS